MCPFGIGNVVDKEWESKDHSLGITLAQWLKRGWDSACAQKLTWGYILRQRPPTCSCASPHLGGPHRGHDAIETVWVTGAHADVSVCVFREEIFAVFLKVSLLAASLINPSILLGRNLSVFKGRFPSNSLGNSECFLERHASALLFRKSLPVVS